MICACNCIKLVGLYFLSLIAMKVFKVIKSFLAMRTKEPYLNQDWIAITGSTDGIGLEMCRELRRQKRKLIIFGRSPEKLKKVQ